MPRLPTCVVLVFAFSLLGCTKTSETSRPHARAHAEFLAAAAIADVEEIQKGLPQGAKHLERFFAEEKPGENATESSIALENARNRIKDLRTAKSTFFLVAEPGGRILRSDQEHDALAGKNLFEAFGELKAAAAGQYVEARGSMPELSRVRGRGDGQWAAAVPVSKDGAVRGVYASGWSWSAYAYRLENQIRSKVRSELAAGGKEPLLYVYMVVDKDVYGAPISPDSNAKRIKESGLLGRASGEAVVDVAQEIEGRDFGIALRRVPALGVDVAIAILRSET